MTDGFLFFVLGPQTRTRTVSGIIGSHTAFWGMSAGQMNVTKPGLLLNMAL